MKIIQYCIGTLGLRVAQLNIKCLSIRSKLFRISQWRKSVIRATKLWARIRAATMDAIVRIRKPLLSAVSCLSQTLHKLALKSHFKHARRWLVDSCAYSGYILHMRLIDQAASWHSSSQVMKCRISPPRMRPSYYWYECLKTKSLPRACLIFLMIVYRLGTVL
jgi:hypothetical protein